MALAGQLAIEIVGNLRGMKASFKEAKQETRDLQQSLQNYGSQMQSIGRKMTTFVTGPAALMAGAVAKIGMDFEDSLNQSIAIMGDVSDTMRNKMAQTAQEVASQLDVSNKEAAESYYYLASAGYDAEQAIAALPQVAEFATAGQFEMKEATDLLTDAQSALGLSVDDAQENMQNMTKVSDTLVKANTIANASVQQFSESLTNDAAAALRSANKSIEEGVAVLSVFADQGRKGQRAGRELARAMRYMRKAAQENKDALEEYNVDIYDANGNMRNMADIVEDLENALVGMSDQQKDAALAQMGFNAETQQVIKMLMGTSEQIRNYQEELENAGGTTESVADKQMQSIKKQLGLVKDELVGVINQIFELAKPAIQNTLIPALNSLTDKLEDLVEWYKELSPGMQSFLNKVGLITTIVGPALVVLGTLTKAVAGLIPLFSGLASAIAGISAPVAAAVGAISLLAFELVKNWKETKNMLVQLFDMIVLSFKQLVVNTKKEIVILKEWVGDLKTLWQEFKKSFVSLMKIIGTSLKSFALNVKLAFQQMQKAVVSSLEKLLNKISILEKIPGKWGEKFAEMNEAVDGAFDNAKNSIEDTKESLEENEKTMSKLMQNLKESGGNIKEAFTSLSDETQKKLKELSKEWKNNNGEIKESAKSFAKSFMEVSGSTVDDINAIIDVIFNLGKETKNTVDKINDSTKEIKKGSRSAGESAMIALKKAEDAAVSYANSAGESAMIAVQEVEKIPASYRHSAGESAMIARDMSDETLAAIVEMQEKWSDKVFEETNDRVAILKKEKQDVIKQTKEKAEELEMSEENLNQILADINKYYDEKITEEEEKQAEERKNIKDRLMQYKHDQEQISYKEYKSYLQDRLKSYEKGSSEWIAIKNKIIQLEKDHTDEAKSEAQKREKLKQNEMEYKFKQEKIGYKEYKKYLEKRLKDAEKYSDEWIQIKAEIANLKKPKTAWEKFVSKATQGVKDIAGSIKTIYTDLLNGVVSKLDFGDVLKSLSTGDIPAAFSSMFGKVAEESDQFNKTIKSMNETIMKAIEPILPAFNKLFKAIEPLAEPIGRIMKLIGEMVVDLLEPMIPVIDKMLDFMGDLLEAIMPAVKPIAELLSLLMSLAVDILKPIVIPVFKAVAEAVKFVVNSMISFVNGVIELVNKIPGVNFDKLEEFNSAMGEAADAAKSSAEAIQNSADAQQGYFDAIDKIEPFGLGFDDIGIDVRGLEVGTEEFNKAYKNGIKAAEKIFNRVKDIFSSVQSNLKSAFSADTTEGFLQKFGKNLKQTIKQNLIQGFMESEAIKPMMKKLSGKIFEATEDGEVTDEELSGIEKMYDNITEKASGFFETIQQLDSSMNDAFGISTDEKEKAEDATSGTEKTADYDTVEVTKDGAKTLAPSLNAIMSSMKKLASLSENTMKSMQSLAQSQADSLASIDKKMDKLDTIINELNNLNVDVTINQQQNNTSNNNHSNISQALKNRGLAGANR